MLKFRTSQGRTAFGVSGRLNVGSVPLPPRPCPATARTCVRPARAPPALLFGYRAVTFSVLFSRQMRQAPTTIKRRSKESVEILWNDGHLSVYSNHALREHCPCATCRVRPARSLPVRGPGDVYPVQIGVVGRYAVSIVFNDRPTT